MDSFAYGEIDSLVRDDDITPLAECRDDAADGRKGLGVDDAGSCSQMRGNVRFGLDVHVLCAIEAGRRTGTDAVGAQDLNCLLFQGFVGDQIEEVIRGQVGDGTAVC